MGEFLEDLGHEELFVDNDDFVEVSYQRRSKATRGRHGLDSGVIDEVLGGQQNELLTRLEHEGHCVFASQDPFLQHHLAAVDGFPQQDVRNLQQIQLFFVDARLVREVRVTAPALGFAGTSGSLLLCLFLLSLQGILVLDLDLELGEGEVDDLTYFLLGVECFDEGSFLSHL